MTYGATAGLRINAEKTKTVAVGRSTSSITVEQKDIEFVELFQYIGIHI